MKKFIKSIIKSDIFEHFVNLRYMPRWIIFVLDTTVMIASLLIAGYFADKIQYYPTLDGAAIFKLSLFAVSQILFFWFFRTYSGVLRYSGFVDATKLLLAVVLHTLTIYFISSLWMMTYGFHLYSGKTLLLYGIITFSFLFIIRLVVKTVFDMMNLSYSYSTPVVIYGTKASGVSVAKMLRAESETSYELMGFVDTNKEMFSKVLMGVKVNELSEENVKKLMERNIKTVIVSPQKSKELDLKYDLDVFINNGMTVKMFPKMENWTEELPSLGQLQNIQIDDLLDRPGIVLSTDKISEELRGKTVMVTGGVGSIGSEIVRQCMNFKPKLIVVLDQAESLLYEMGLELKEKFPGQNFAFYIGDVRNRSRMEDAVKIFRPDVIFHAAAYKHVPLMEDNPTEAVQTNVQGTKVMADLAVLYNVSRFVMISTDKAVNPSNVMGASKRIAEIYVQSLNNKLKNNGSATRYITTRFGNVLGSNGSVVPRFKKQIESGGPVTVTHPEIIRYFMTIPEACMLVLEAGTFGNGGEIYIFDMGDPVKIADLAKKMIRLAGFVPEKDILIKYTGLRPGEKLYEELLNQKEITKETDHPKIMIADVREYNYDEISLKIDELIKNSYSGKNFLTVSLMKELVPEFLSNNSQYEKLDVEIKETV